MGKMVRRCEQKKPKERIQTVDDPIDTREKIEKILRLLEPDLPTGVVFLGRFWEPRAAHRLCSIHPRQRHPTPSRHIFTVSWDGLL
jgi:hypothetical protein